MKNPLLSKDYILICLIGFVMSFSTSMSEVLVTKYANYLGASISAIGMISSVASITALLVLPFSAPVADAFKKSKVYLVFAGILAISYAGYAFSNSVTSLVVFRLLNGIGKGAASAIILAMANDCLPENNRSAGIVYFSLASAISVAFAPSAGLFLMKNINFRNTFILGAILLAMTCLMTFLLHDEISDKTEFKLNFHNMFAKEAIPAASVMFFLSMAYSTINSFLVIYATDMGIENIGLYFTVYSIVLLLSRPVIGFASRYVRSEMIMIPSMICFAMAMHLTAVSENLVSFLIAAFISAFGYGACQPLVQAMSIQSAGEGRSGVGSTTCFLGTNLGYLFGPAMGGFVAERSGYSTMYNCMIIPVLVGMGIVIHIIRKKKRELSHGIDY